MNRSSSVAGLSQTQASILSIVVDRERVRASTIAETEGLNPTMVSRILTQLCADGLVDRLPADADARTVIISPTPAGRERSAHIQLFRVAALQRVVDDLPSETVTHLHAALPALEEFSHAMRRAVSPP
ncbi:MarR family winged helix-turn-helix transcriptional regulator [Pseudonocardia sp. GCM10023141]|uniref:MarR family winged helix-turn-helix transcriptional regulator n=1 Tax=Pseudonocardia sp. GCM10023141 TaxID=3252653 RepID=UPI0036106D35